MSEDTKVKVEKTPEQIKLERDAQIEFVARNLKKNDDRAWETLKYSKMKFTQAEFDSMIADKGVKKDAVNKCINELGMLKKYSSYKPKADGEKKVSRIRTIPEAKPFLDNLDKFMADNKVILEMIEKDHKLVYQPFWRAIKDEVKEETGTNTATDTVKV
jgi:hypothetical protein